MTERQTHRGLFRVEILLVLFGMVFASFLSPEETGTLRGTVTDVDGGAPSQASALPYETPRSARSPTPRVGIR